MDFRKNFRREVLDNGITLLYEKRDFPVVSASITSKIGAMYETKEEKGITHFLEHLLFKGEDKRKEIKELESLGGDLNGSTGMDGIEVKFTSPSIGGKKGINLLINLVKNSRFTYNKINKEKKVILEEINRDKNPSTYAFDNLTNSLYFEPFSLPLIGKKSTLDAFTPKDFSKRHKEVFLPKNIVACIVGNLNFEELKDNLENSFEKNEGLYEKAPLIKKKISQVKKYKKGIDQSRFAFSFHSPLPFEKGFYANEVLSGIFMGGMTSRVFLKMREEEPLIYDFFDSTISSPFYSYTSFNFGCSSRNVSKIEKILFKEFQKVSKNLGTKELNNVKGGLIGGYQLEMESSANTVFGLVEYELNGNAEEFYNYEKRINEVQVEEVRKLAGDILENGYGTFTLLPK